jgi:hypothetical protein
MFTYERFGLLTSIIGLLADLIALATIGYSLVNLGENESTVGIIFWLGMFSIIPLTYFWGFLTWLVNLKFGQPNISTLAVGSILTPFYLVWGLLILGAAIREEPLILSGCLALLIQFFLGFIIYFVITVWNFLLR